MIFRTIHRVLRGRIWHIRDERYLAAAIVHDLGRVEERRGREKATVGLRGVGRLWGDRSPKIYLKRPRLVADLLAERIVPRPRSTGTHVDLTLGHAGVGELANARLRQVERVGQLTLGLYCRRCTA